MTVGEIINMYFVHPETQIVVYNARNLRIIDFHYYEDGNEDLINEKVSAFTFGCDGDIVTIILSPKGVI